MNIYTVSMYGQLIAIFMNKVALDEYLNTSGMKFDYPEVEEHIVDDTSFHLTICN